ncbi:hypothetical protein C5167_041211 [Papaver somniferum]|uniref:Uncharacterized protein n=1 Tax=Papaver somniferum TaxID=3469 RepID=A0A4Y7IH70_PAPSO|nr:hypothetical protein C5167_041211 [Papaver somniferum]
MIFSINNIWIIDEKVIGENFRLQFSNGNKGLRESIMSLTPSGLCQDHYLRSFCSFLTIVYFAFRFALLRSACFYVIEYLKPDVASVQFCSNTYMIYLLRPFHMRFSSKLLLPFS